MSSPRTSLLSPLVGDDRGYTIIITTKIVVAKQVELKLTLSYRVG